MNSNVIDQLIFSFEGQQISTTILPVANILVVVKSGNVFVVNMSYYVLHHCKLFIAWFGFGER